MARWIPAYVLAALAALWQVQDFRAQHSVDSKPSPPSPEQETWATDRLAELGILEPVMAAMYDFYTFAHSGTIAGKALLQLRMRARASHRMRAMGIACIAIDVGLGLLGTLSTHSQTGFQAMADAFRDDPDCDAAQWTNQAILRVIFRHGMMQVRWPEAELRWPTCFFGMLTAALAFTGKLLTRHQRRALTILFLRSADLGCTFARHIIYGHEYGAGLIYWVDSTQPDVPAVSFTHASLHGFLVLQGPDATDLASRLVQIYRGEVEGIEAHPLYEPAVHSRLYCLGVVRSWLIDTARDGTPRPSRPPHPPAPRTQPPSHVCRAGKRLMNGMGLAIFVAGECELDRSDMAADAIEAAAADGECAAHLQLGDCEGEGEHEGDGDVEESDDMDADMYGDGGVDGEMNGDMAPGSMDADDMDE